MQKKKSKNKKKNKKSEKRNILIISLLLVVTLTIVTIIVFSFPNYEEKQSTNNYIVGKLYTPNAAANMIDYLYDGKNIVMSPINADISLSLIYNASDNTTKKELKKYFNNEPSANNEIITKKISNLNSNISKTKKENYEKYIQKFIDNNYQDLRVKDIDKLSQKDREEMLLILRKIEMFYDQSNNKYKDKEIEKYKLTDKEKKYNGYAIKEIIDKIMVKYENYQIENKIYNYNEYYYSSEKKVKIEKEFLSSIKDYNINLTSIDFNNKESDSIVSNNLNNYTNNKITRAISDNNLKSESLISINSLYFNYEWDTIFNSEDIIDEEFTDLNEKHYMVDMMYSEENTYLENEQAIGFIKNFKDNKYSFVGILPKEKDNIEISNLDIESLLSSKKETKVYVGIPKFSFNSLNNLNELYQNYNINDLFTNKANLHQMSDNNLYIDKMYQKQSITIGEYGTVEGTTKTNTLSTKTLDDTTKSVILNRTFSFLIIENETEEVLMIGIFNNPN